MTATSNKRGPGFNEFLPKDSVYSPMRCRDWLKVKAAAGRETMQKRAEAWEKS